VDDVQHNIRIITLTVLGTEYKLWNYHESALIFIREIRLSMYCNYLENNISQPMEPTSLVIHFLFMFSTK
jgi:hypothetical protein